ncbi:MAG: hypothetical protein JXA58_08075 [Dehalococcoidia bacterium]|nr:hypothetical protein [Dehalococcoidia bacterium]
MRIRLRVCVVVAMALLMLAPSSAYGALAYSIGMNWDPAPWYDYDLFNAAETAYTYHAAMGYGAQKYEVAWASDIYNNLGGTAIMYLVSHSTAGRMVFWNSGRDQYYSCLRSTLTYTAHTHTISGWTGACNHQRALRERPGEVPTRILMFQGCNTADAVTTTDRGLLWASYYEGVDHSAGFEESILIALNADRDFSYGYWKSLTEGKYTVEAMDAGVDRVQWLHFGLTGNYDSWRYWGSNIRVN